MPTQSTSKKQVRLIQIVGSAIVLVIAAACYCHAMRSDAPVLNRELSCREFLATPDGSDESMLVVDGCSADPFLLIDQPDGTAFAILSNRQTVDVDAFLSGAEFSKFLRFDSDEPSKMPVMYVAFLEHDLVVKYRKSWSDAAVRLRIPPDVTESQLPIFITTWGAGTPTLGRLELRFAKRDMHVAIELPATISVENRARIEKLRPYIDVAPLVSARQASSIAFRHD
jgi:hypothetical protein